MNRGKVGSRIICKLDAIGRRPKAAGQRACRRDHRSEANTSTAGAPKKASAVQSNRNSKPTIRQATSPLLFRRERTSQAAPGIAPQTNNTNVPGSGTGAKLPLPL